MGPDLKPLPGFPARSAITQHIPLQLTTITKAANYSYSSHRATQEGCSLYCLCELGSSSCKLALNRPSFTKNCCPSTTDAHLKYCCFSTMKVHRLLLLLFPHCRQYMAYTDQGTEHRTCVSDELSIGVLPKVSITD